ncbi:Bifunctional homocysteine S-methyltransferase/5,10-methylenetetrahydrofolate reductase [Methanosarcinaceae archaeon Ag5]|uniref:Bifunctional homocysteine S-methyltransferase/5,10-methylenetetrahydrofolate reductase n=1 Tax=Methanolapillus africanus TaxID=3028297 RepID=A0AAE4SDA8_9EURY|nr:Bifunctional homocysteine S-methyltransferase/5,10-methylenetetrahydrofolate reductase [Methanosarcinaceae archaeon Ag5]
MVLKSKFHEKLLSDQFLITGEVSPPKGTDVSAPLKNAELIHTFADAINVTDNQCATMHMSSLAFSRLLVEKNYEPIMQLTCRDRNRIGLQADLLGASALGISNLLVMSGDHPATGDHPKAKAVYDLDSVQLLKTISQMKEGADMSGSRLNKSPAFCVGVVSNADPNERLQLMKLEKKLLFDVDFIQTQAIFDIEKFKEFLEKINVYDIPILAGIIPIRSIKMADYMNNHIPGISIPADIRERIECAENPEAEGILIAAELIYKLKSICRGVHMMPVGPHTNTKLVLQKAGVLE